MPSEKRARQRAMRELKVAEQQKYEKRTRRLKRTGGLIVIVGLIVGVIFLVSGGSGKKPVVAGASGASGASGVSGASGPSGASGATSTTTAPTTTTLAAAAIAPACPPATAAGAAKRVIAFKAAPKICISPTGTYEASIATDVGTFVIKMAAANSLLAVNNFVFLARYHFYDGVTFHRVIPGFVVQGGDPTGTGSGGPGYNFNGNTPAKACQTTNNCYPLGSVAVANSGDTSSDSSQFFVVTGTQGEQLPPSYTLFGQVISGMSVVNRISADGTQAGTPKVTHHMIKVSITQLAA